jgi:hypothetical protein
MEAETIPITAIQATAVTQITITVITIIPEDRIGEV